MSDATRDIAIVPADGSNYVGVPSTSGVSGVLTTMHGRTLPTAEQAPRGALLVSKRQEGNPVLRHLRCVRWMYASITPDYQVGSDAAVLYLSMRYHLLHPEYIHTRTRELLRSFALRILLVHVDLEDVHAPLQDITCIAMHSRFTLVCCFSTAECARYLETYKCYEHKPADAIRERTEQDYESRRAHVLTAVRGVNRTDVVSLGSKMGSVAGIMRAKADDLAAVPGIGPIKALRLHEAFNAPFRVVRSSTTATRIATPSKTPTESRDVETIVITRTDHRSR